MSSHNPGRRETLLALGAAPLALHPALALAQGASPREGEEYRSLPRSVPTDAPDKIVVLDFFRYGCPHCYEYLPYIESWQRRQGPDVVLQHAPVAFDESQDPQARLWFALRALGREDLHRKVFEAIHVSHKHLDLPDEIAEFMASSGIPRDKWNPVFNAFSMAPAVKRARETFIAYTVDGTPMIGIEGRWVTAPSMMRSARNAAHAQELSFTVVDWFVERVRAERSKRKG